MTTNTPDAPTALGALLQDMTEESVTTCGLDAKTLMQVRLAALVALSASPSSYLMNLGASAELGLDDDDVRSVLIAVAPLVGTARTVSAVTGMAESLGIALSLDGAT